VFTTEPSSAKATGWSLAGPALRTTAVHPNSARGALPASLLRGISRVDVDVTGEPDGPPTSVGLPICDLGTGIWAAQGILAALYERQRTGKGRLVECSLLETAVGFSSWTSAQWLADHEEPTRQGSRHRQNAPYQRMQTKDGYLMVGAAGEAIWRAAPRRWVASASLSPGARRG
jgi:crotonobetainyl-CoA:carnitine CoA-transferase CaiB-like acyl-CoA transferase